MRYTLRTLPQRRHRGRALAGDNFLKGKVISSTPSLLCWEGKRERSLLCSALLCCSIRSSLYVHEQRWSIMYFSLEAALNLSPPLALEPRALGFLDRRALGQRSVLPALGPLALGPLAAKNTVYPSTCIYLGSSCHACHFDNIKSSINDA